MASTKSAVLPKICSAQTLVEQLNVSCANDHYRSSVQQLCSANHDTGKRDNLREAIRCRYAGCELSRYVMYAELLCCSFATHLLPSAHRCCDCMRLLCSVHMLGACIDHICIVACMVNISC